MVRERLPERKLLRQAAGQVLPAPADPGIRPHQRVPLFHGAVHLHYVRYADVPGEGRLGGHGTGFLDDHTGHHDRRRDPLVRLRTAHLVFVLPHGYPLFLGDAAQRQAPRELPAHLRRRQMPTKAGVTRRDFFTPTASNAGAASPAVR